MTLRARSLVRLLGTSAAIAACVAMAPGTAGAVPPQGTPLPATSAAAAPATYSITLITGDTVHVTELGKGRTGIRITKGKNREHITFVTRRTPSGVSVIPSDAIKLLSSDRLDERLFNLTLLKKWRYDDAHSKEIPLMVTGAAGTTASAMPGARTVR
jgi:hypothetical protein